MKHIYDALTDMIQLLISFITPEQNYELITFLYSSILLNDNKLLKFIFK